MEHKLIGKTVWITNPKDLGIYKEICYTGPVRIKLNSRKSYYTMYFPITIAIFNYFDDHCHERNNVILIESEMNKLEYREI